MFKVSLGSFGAFPVCDEFWLKYSGICVLLSWNVTSSRVSRPLGLLFKITTSGHEISPLEKLPNAAYMHILCLTIRARNWVYFRAMGSGYRDTGRLILKIAILWHEISIWKTFQKLHMVFLPVVSGIQVDFQNCSIWAWNMGLDKSSRKCACTLFVPQRVEVELIFGQDRAILHRFCSHVN